MPFYAFPLSRSSRQSRRVPLANDSTAAGTIEESKPGNRHRQGCGREPEIRARILQTRKATHETRLFRVARVTGFADH